MDDWDEMRRRREKNRDNWKLFIVVRINAKTLLKASLLFTILLCTIDLSSTTLLAFCIVFFRFSAPCLIPFRTPQFRSLNFFLFAHCITVWMRFACCYFDAALALPFAIGSLRISSAMMTLRLLVSNFNYRIHKFEALNLYIYIHSFGLHDATNRKFNLKRLLPFTWH